MITLETFINRNLGKKLDYDNAFGAQCVDLIRFYIRDVLNINEHTGAVDGAKDLYLKYEELPKEKKYFERITKSRRPIFGDIIVWNGTPQNQYGHTAIYLGETNSGFFVLEQNGFTQDGVELKIRSRLNLLGFLRKR